jgi:predicted transcriptional regulator
MARTPNDITDAELGVLQVLWDLGSATVREIVERLYPESTLSLHATVQKLLERLESSEKA